MKLQNISNSLVISAIFVYHVSCNRLTREIESISQSKCREYKNLVTTSPERKFNGKKIRPLYDCSRTSLVIPTGSNTYPGEFPHLAAVGRTVEGSHPKFFCTGSLISDRFVLTAALCNNEFTPEFVRLGDQNLIKKDDGATPMDYDILKFIRHGNYSSQTGEHDIALIELTQSVIFNKFIRPACLNQDTGYAGKVVATVWGRSARNRKLSFDLMKIELNTSSNDLCSEQLKKERISVFPTDMCAAGANGKDSCLYEAGAPVHVAHSDATCVFDIVGVASRIPRRCGATKPNVLVRISSYLDWIEGTVWPLEEEKYIWSSCYLCDDRRI